MTLKTIGNKIQSGYDKTKKAVQVADKRFGFSELGAVAKDVKFKKHKRRKRRKGLRDL